MRLLTECARTGDWLCLKNLHLVVAWLPTLEKEIYVLKAHEDFRLFLTSEPHAKFPSTLLEGSLKITYEAPPRLKRNVSRTYRPGHPSTSRKAARSAPSCCFCWRGSTLWFRSVSVRAAGLVEILRVFIRRPSQRRRHHQPGV